MITARNADWSALPTIRVIAFRAVLYFAEVGEQFLISPTWLIAIAPFVVFVWRAPHEQHAVDGAGSAEQFPARPIYGLLVKLRFWFSVEAPNEAWVCQEATNAYWDVNPRMPPFTACLQQ